MGSSKTWPQKRAFNGILSNKHSTNPAFYSYNHVFINYCDGGSFAGDHKITTKSECCRRVLPLTSFLQVFHFLIFHFALAGHLRFFGKRILESVIEHLVSQKGMRHARRIVLSGASAGGLAGNILFLVLLTPC